MVEGILIAGLSVCILVLTKRVYDLQMIIRNMDYNQFMNSMNYEMDSTCETESRTTNDRIIQ